MLFGQLLTAEKRGEISLPVSILPLLHVVPLSHGRFYLSCMGYPACKTAVWFPDFVLDVAKDESICAECGPHPVHR